MWFDSNSCPEHFHEFRRTEKGIEVFHGDETPCEQAEYNLSERDERDAA